MPQIGLSCLLHRRSALPSPRTSSPTARPSSGTNLLPSEPLSAPGGLGFGFRGVLDDDGLTDPPSWSSTRDHAGVEGGAGTR